MMRVARSHSAGHSLAQQDAGTALEVPPQGGGGGGGGRGGSGGGGGGGGDSGGESFPQDTGARSARASQLRKSASFPAPPWDSNSSERASSDDSSYNSRTGSPSTSKVAVGVVQLHTS